MKAVRTIRSIWPAFLVACLLAGIASSLGVAAMRPGSGAIPSAVRGESPCLVRVEPAVLRLERSVARGCAR